MCYCCNWSEFKEKEINESFELTGRRGMIIELRSLFMMDNGSTCLR